MIEIFDRFGISYRLAPHKNVRRNWCGVDCFKCSPNSEKFRLGFELATGRCHCWVCGKFQNSFALAQLLRIRIKEAESLLQNNSYRVQDWKQEERTGTLVLPKGVGPLQQPHRRYLEKGRNLNPDEMAEIWGAQGIGIASRFQWSIFIPIYDRFGRMVSWTTRAIGKEIERRYRSASEDEEEVPHKSLLYGAHRARHTIIIVEGPLDVWTIGPGAVATCGVGYSSAQLAIMAEYPYRVVCFDAEDDAQRRADELCMELSCMPGTTENVILETGKDANAADPDEVAELRMRYFEEVYA